MIRLNNLELKNFLSHVDTDISLDDYEGLVLIEGKNSSGFYSSNGSGKSTLLEGLIYALTGDTLRGVSVNDVINRNYKKNTKVSLRFTKDDTMYTVDRYRKDDIRGDSIVLYKGDEAISKRVNKDTQKSLEDILNISYKILVSTILLGEGLSSRFTQLSDPEKKSLIESTLNLNYDISAIRTKANNQLSQLKLEKSNIEGKMSVIKELSSIDIEETRRLIEEQEAQASKMLSDIDSLKRSLEEMKGSKDTLSNKITLVSNSLQQHNYYTVESNRILAEIGQYNQELERVDTAPTPLCTVCHQPLSSHESRKSFQDTYRSKIDIASQKLSEVQSLLSSLPDKSILESTYQRLCEERDSIDTKISETNNSINQINSNYWELSFNIDRLKDSIKRYEESTADITTLEEEEKILGSSIAKYEYFYKLFSPTGIIVNILSDAINYINERLSTYSEVLLEKDYNINFVKGKISLIDNKGSSYQSLSNGEKRRLDIAIQFSLHDYCMRYCGNSVDTMFIDEILDTLDDIGIENIITVLRMKLEYCNLSRIFVISHNSELKSYFDKVITVVKDANGDSKIEK